MALVFQVPPPFRFQRVEGPQSEQRQVSFNRPINQNIGAQVAIQAFSLDIEGAPDPRVPLDKIQVTSRQVGIGGNDVTIEVAVNYAGKIGSEVEYNASVTVLVIADLF
jgi:hypothetical protein